MRLAVVSPFVDRRHGTERAVAELIERLAKTYGCEVHLYAQAIADIAVRDPRAAPASKEGAIYWHKVSRVRGPHIGQFLAWMYLNERLRRRDVMATARPYDLVLSPGVNCRNSDVIIVHALFHRLVELMKRENEEKEARPNIFTRLHRGAYYHLLANLERKIYSNPKVKLAALSRRTAELMKQYFHRNDVRVIANGVDTAYFSARARLARRTEARRRRGFQDDHFVLLLIGNDWRVKGLLSVLDAMSALHTLPIRLIVVGSDEPGPFREHSRELGVYECCRFERPRSDVLDFYAAADLYVSPSREDSFPLPVAEAMVCGLPVITSVFAGGVAELIQDGVDGFVLRNPRDAQTLAELIQRLEGDPAVRQKIGEAAARKACTWTWDRHATAVWELIKT